MSGTQQLQCLPGASAVLKAYEWLRSAILAGALEPGDRLRESAIAARLRMSRTPVREAFRRLEAEGWLEIIPNAGVRVSEWSISDVEDMFEVRALIETSIAARAALNASEAEIARIGELARDLTELAATGSRGTADERALKDAAFHDTLAEAACSRRLARLRRMVVEIPMVRWTFDSFDQTEIRRSAAHHSEIAAALAARDADWASAAMRSHIHSARHAVLRRLRARAG